MRNRQSGPGIFITAAFIGPGTLTVCTLAGTGFGFELLWVLLFALIATVVLQDMALRVGAVGRQGLGEALSSFITKGLIRYIVLSLVFVAIVFGNAAYEAGNISGAALGISSVVPDANWTIGLFTINPYSIIIGLLAISLIVKGSFRILRNVLMVAVIVMSLAFLLAAIYTQPKLSELMSGFVPSVPSGALLTTIALLGTTVVPYNLFLHASLSKMRWTGMESIQSARMDSFYAILIGVFISISIVITAAFNRGGEVTSVLEMAAGLEPVFGKYAAYIVGTGLMAAGLSSAITAPLAAGFVCSELFGWDRGMKNIRFQILAAFIVVIGVFFSSLGIKPVLLIQVAQAANGIILPIIAFLLLWLANSKGLLGNYVNKLGQNILTVFVILITLVLGLRSLMNVIL